MNKNKIQSLLITHLQKHGQIELLLPDGVVLEIGVTQEDKNGKLKIEEDYCWVIATHKDRSTAIDPFNMGLKFADHKDMLVFEDQFIDYNGEFVRRVDVV